MEYSVGRADLEGVFVVLSSEMHFRSVVVALHSSNLGGSHSTNEMESSI